MLCNWEFFDNNGCNAAFVSFTRSFHYSAFEVRGNYSTLLLNVSITRHFPDVVVTRRFRYLAYPVHGNYSTFQILGLSEHRLNPLLDVSIIRRFTVTNWSTANFRDNFGFLMQHLTAGTKVSLWQDHKGTSTLLVWNINYSFKLALLNKNKIVWV